MTIDLTTYEDLTVDQITDDTISAILGVLHG